jgi:hypothetical protein
VQVLSRHAICSVSPRASTGAARARGSGPPIRGRSSTRQTVSRFRFRLAAALTALLGAYACGGDGIVLPDESLPADVEVTSGNGQLAPAGATLDDALVVQVTDSRGRPVADQGVSFTITAGGGQVTPSTARTDADGTASTS